MDGKHKEVGCGLPAPRGGLFQARAGGPGAGPVVTQCWPGKLPQHVGLEKPEPGDPS